MPSIAGWFRPTASLSRLYIRSAPQRFGCHFVPGVGSARCHAPECQLCGAMELHHHAIVCVQVGQERTLMLHEIRAADAAVIEELMHLGEDAIGWPLFVWRDEAEHGSPIRSSLQRPGWAQRSMSETRLELKRVHCERYIQAIGTREYRRAVSALDHRPPALEIA